MIRTWGNILLLCMVAACSRNNSTRSAIVPGLDDVANFAIVPPASVTAGSCSSSFRIDFQNSSGNIVGLAKSLNLFLSTNGPGFFYRDAQCTELASTIPAESGESGADFYFLPSSAGTQRIRVVAIVAENQIQRDLNVLVFEGSSQPPEDHAPETPGGIATPSGNNGAPSSGNASNGGTNTPPGGGSTTPPPGGDASSDGEAPVVGKLDETFNGTGRTLLAMGPKESRINQIVVDRDQNILAAGHVMNKAGYQDWGLARFRPDGTLDTNFGAGGKVVTAFSADHDTAQSVAVQPDGKIVVGGYATVNSTGRFALARYTTTGVLDTTFNQTGKVTTLIRSYVDVLNEIMITSDNRIVGVGYSRIKQADGSPVMDSAIVRYNSDGTLDTTFNTKGSRVTSTGGGNDAFYAVAEQPDGKILAAGDSACCVEVARYTSTGLPDPTWGANGVARRDIVPNVDENIRAMALQKDGRVVVAGFTNGANKDILVVRYHANSALDADFGTYGVVKTAIGPGNDFATAVAIQDDGKIVVSGYSEIAKKNVPIVIRYLPNGALDTSFGTGGIYQLPSGATGEFAQAVALQSDGKIVVGGSTVGALGQFLLFRLK